MRVHIPGATRAKILKFWHQHTIAWQNCCTDCSRYSLPSTLDAWATSRIKFLSSRPPRPKPSSSVSSVRKSTASLTVFALSTGQLLQHLLARRGRTIPWYFLLREEELSHSSRDPERFLVFSMVSSCSHPCQHSTTTSGRHCWSRGETVLHTLIQSTREFAQEQCGQEAIAWTIDSS